MTHSIADISLRKAARIAGSGYVILFVLGLFVNFFVLERLIIPGDAVTTANNIAASEVLFRIAIVGWLFVVICDVVVAWALYVLLTPVNRGLSLLAAWFRLVWATIFGITLLNLVIVSHLGSGADYLRVFETGQLNALMLLFFNAYNFGFLLGLVFFAFHLVVLASLIFKLGHNARILGVLLIVAALGYLIDSLANFLLPNYADFETIFLLIVAVPAIIAEFALMFWLLFKAGNAQPEATEVRL